MQFLERDHLSQDEVVLVLVVAIGGLFSFPFDLVVV